MAEAIPEVWECDFQGKKRFGAYGPRDVLIIVSSESLEGPDIVPRKKGELTQEDKDRLTSEGIPPESWLNDAKLMNARYRKEETYYSVIGTESDLDMTVNYVLRKITTLLRDTRKPGVVIHYIGPGKRKSGDWCFKDGFITFEEIILLYNRYFIGKELVIDCDCSYSGEWVKLLMDYLDECKITPCAHSARAAGKLLAVTASCRSDEVPHSLYFSARGHRNDKNTGMPYNMNRGYEIAEDQHLTYSFNSTLTCKAANFEAPCLFPPNYTFQKKRVAERLFCIRNPDLTQWGVFLVIDDDNIIDLVRNGRVAAGDYGELIQSGDGRDPPKEVKEWIDKEYPGQMLF